MTALPSRVCRFDIELADTDRHVYESLCWRVAQHPSEEAERVIVRVVARCLLYEARLSFGTGLSTAQEPALWVRAPDGRVRLWVDVGAPAAQRLHKASKLAERVVVVSHKAPEVLARAWGGKKVHRADAIEVAVIDPDAVRGLAAGLGKSVRWVVSCSGGSVHVSDQQATFSFEWTPRPLADFQ